MQRRRKARHREQIAADLEILPLMNLFVVLIPMLLLSAVFLEITVIRMNLPTDEESPDSPRETLGLSVSILPEQWVVKGRRLETMRLDRAGENAEAALSELLAGIATSHPEDHDLIIRSEDDTHYDDIVTVMDVSRGAGLENISLAGDAEGRN